VHEFRILGPLEVLVDGTRVALGGPRQRATLALLLLDANRVVPVERLADRLYAGRPPVTAVTQVQRQVSELRKALGSPTAIETRPPGYLLRLVGELDLARFERLTERAHDELSRGDAAAAAALLRDALALWRGPALADLEYESFARATAERLEELRLAALEARVDADLLLGRHSALTAELEQLASEHPLRERLRGQWMLALYRAGRQTEALEVYRNTRRTLVERFGIEPSPALKALERAILAHDASLAAPDEGTSTESRGAVLVAPSTNAAAGDLLALVGAPARAAPRELIVARLAPDQRELDEAVADLRSRRAAAHARIRVAAFTSSSPADDLVRLATVNDVDLVLVDAPPGVDAAALPVALSELLDRCPADVAVAVRRDHRGGQGLYVPFGGGEHDWAALELAAWLAKPTGAPLRLLGTGAHPARGRRDASRLLADASLAVQRVLGVDAEPVLARADVDALVTAVAGAALVVTGISPRWRGEGIGEARRRLVRAAIPAVVLVHRGPRPGVLAPREGRTRFTWTIEGEAYLQAVSTAPT
jgi:DNA-binding SARP family transcriptional activator